MLASDMIVESRIIGYDLKIYVIGKEKKCQRYLNYVKVVLIVDHQNSQDIVRLVALVVSLYKKERK